MRDEMKNYNYTNATYGTKKSPTDGNELKSRSIMEDAHPVRLEGVLWPNPGNALHKNENGKWLASVKVIDPLTKLPTVLEDIPIRQISETSIQRLRSTTRVFIDVPDVRYITRHESSKMIATLTEVNLKTENNAIPSGTLFSNYRAGNSAENEGKNRLCNLGKFSFLDESKLLHTKEGMTVFTDPDNPSSGGMVVDSTKDELIMFNKTGHNFSMDKKGINVKAKQFNMGSSGKQKEGMGTGGLPSNENKIADMYPKSNILLNVPMVQTSYLVNLHELLLGLGLVYKLIKVGEVAKKALEES